jgi:hypothetical protein
MEFKLKNILNSKVDIILIFSLLLYSIMGIYLISHYQYATGADGMSYINIAKLYLIGDLKDAINGYWGPLFSWLLVPFLKIFGSNPFVALYASRALTLIIGFFTIIGVRLLSYRFEMNDKIRNVIIVTLIPFILYVALGPIQPDLLFACFFVYYLNIIYNNDYPNKYAGILCGFLGALAFLTKEYALPFFLATFILFNILHYLKDISKAKKRLILKNLSLGLLVFVLIGGIWAGTISDKYGKLTFGNSGEYNWGVDSPTSLGHPTQLPGFIKPPYPKAISAWEDPSYLKVQSSWSPFHSYANLKHEYLLTTANILRVFEFYNVFSYFGLIVLILYIILIIRPIKEIITRQSIFYPLITVLILPLGYIISSLESRYLYLVYILLLLMGGYLLNLLFKTQFLTKYGKTLLTIIFVISFIIMPINGLTSFYDYDKSLYSWGNTLEIQHDISGNIASNGNNFDGYYGDTLALSYFLGTSYYGFSKPNMTNNDLKAEFKKYGINYYFVWGNSSNDAFLSNYKKVNNGNILNLRIYAVNGGK